MTPRHIGHVVAPPRGAVHHVSRHVEWNVFPHSCLDRLHSAGAHSAAPSLAEGHQNRVSRQIGHSLSDSECAFEGAPGPKVVVVVCLRVLWTVHETRVRRD